MKILQIANKPPFPAVDGGTIAMLQHTFGFVSNGHSVDILAMNTPKHFVDLNKFVEKELPVPSFHLHYVIVDVKINWMDALRNLFFSKIPYNAERFINKQFANQLNFLLTCQEFDIVQLEGLYLCPYIELIRQKSKAIIALRAHNIENEIWQRAAVNKKNVFKKIYFKIIFNRLKKFEQSFINKYDLLVPITKRDAAVFEQMGNVKPSFVSPVGYSNSKSSKGKTNISIPSLYHLGALDWLPNQEGLLWFINHCWQAIHKQFPELKFYIGGRNASEKFIQSIKKPGIVYCGEVPDAEAFISDKAILIAPLFSGGGMRVKIIESMSFAKVVVTTTIGAEGIEIKHRKNILIANDAQSFVENICALLENKPLYDEIAKNALTFVSENFDAKVLVKSLIDFYLEQINE